MFIINKLRNLLKGNYENIINITRCNKCNGSGIMKYDKPIICKNCNGKTCYMCEYGGSCRLMGECDVCFGKGEIHNF